MAAEKRNAQRKPSVHDDSLSTERNFPIIILDAYHTHTHTRARARARAYNRLRASVQSTAYRASLLVADVEMKYIENHSRRDRLVPRA